MAMARGVQRKVWAAARFVWFKEKPGRMEMTSAANTGRTFLRIRRKGPWHSWDGGQETPEQVCVLVESFTTGKVSTLGKDSCNV